MPYVKRNSIPQCRRPGVYLITNKRNGLVYVGSSICIRGRLVAHRGYLRIGKHDNSYLQRAWTKYGEASFRFDVLETCEVTDTLVKEQQWIDSLKAADRRYGYNLAPKAGSTRGYKWSPESCKRNSEAQIKLGRDLSGISRLAAEVSRGKPRPPEVKAKISASSYGKPKGPQSETGKANHWSRGPNATAIAEKFANSLRGRRLSVEHRAKIAEGNRRRHAAYRAGIIDATS